jgi:hypothetical protein
MVYPNQKRKKKTGAEFQSFPAEEHDHASPDDVEPRHVPLESPVQPSAPFCCSRQASSFQDSRETLLILSLIAWTIYLYMQVEMENLDQLVWLL